jgi:pimeloyl-ACP methyl ester carboxylesterase
VSAWVLLRGLVREQRHWGDFPARLGAALPQSRVLTLDLPGNGARHAERSPARIGAMVENCRASLRTRGVAGPVNVLALSLGGMVALEWAARYPDEVARLVMVNTSMRPFSPFYRRLRPRNYAAIVGQVATGDAAAMERLVLRLTSNRPLDAALLERWIGYQRQYPVTRVNAVRQLLAAARYRAPALAPARTRMLVLSSAADRLVDAACSRALASAWRLAHAVHPTAGHDLPLDDGAWVAAQVARWLAAT